MCSCIPSTIAVSLGPAPAHVIEAREVHLSEFPWDVVYTQNVATDFLLDSPSFFNRVPFILLTRRTFQLEACLGGAPVIHISLSTDKGPGMCVY